MRKHIVTYAVPADKGQLYWRKEEFLTKLGAEVNMLFLKMSGAREINYHSEIVDL